MNRYWIVLASVCSVIVITACSDGVSSLDAACSGTLVTKFSQNGQERISKESRVVPFHYVRSTKRLTIGTRPFPSGRVHQNDGVINGSMEPITLQMNDGTTSHVYERVNYDVKTNIVYHETTLVRSGVPESTTTEIFETVCKPSK